MTNAEELNREPEHPQLVHKLPPRSTLTPHMKEFDTLFGEHNSWWHRLQTGLEQAQKLNIYIILKNDYTITLSPDGKAYFNSTGNAAMASGGMGDVLTGIIAALLAQKYTPLQACLAAIYIHGK